jgi:hypothetical protein
VPEVQRDAEEPRVPPALARLAVEHVEERCVIVGEFGHGSSPVVGSLVAIKAESAEQIVGVVPRLIAGDVPDVVDMKLSLLAAAFRAGPVVPLHNAQPSLLPLGMGELRVVHGAALLNQRGAADRVEERQGIDPPEVAREASEATPDIVQVESFVPEAVDD